MSDLLRYAINEGNLWNIPHFNLTECIEVFRDSILDDEINKKQEWEKRTFINYAACLYAMGDRTEMKEVTPELIISLDNLGTKIKELNCIVNIVMLDRFFDLAVETYCDDIPEQFKNRIQETLGLLKLPGYYRVKLFLINWKIVLDSRDKIEVDPKKPIEEDLIGILPFSAIPFSRISNPKICPFAISLDRLDFIAHTPNLDFDKTVKHIYRTIKNAPKEYLDYVIESYIGILERVRPKYQDIVELNKYYPRLMNLILKIDEIEEITEIVWNIGMEDYVRQAYILGLPIQFGIPSKKIINQSLVRLAKLGPEKYSQDVCHKGTDCVKFNYEDYQHFDTDGENLILIGFEEYSPFDRIQFVQDDHIYEFTRDTWKSFMDQSKETYELNPYNRQQIDAITLRNIKFRMIVAEAEQFPDAKPLIEIIKNHKLKSLVEIDLKELD
jgi:hypothetical protein